VSALRSRINLKENAQSDVRTTNMARECARSTVVKGPIRHLQASYFGWLSNVVTWHDFFG